MILFSAVTFLLLGLTSCAEDRELRVKVAALEAQLGAATTSHSLQIAEMKQQVDALREEVARARAAEPRPEPPAAWTRAAVAELREESRHLRALLNSTGLLQRHNVMDRQVREVMTRSAKLSKQVEDFHKQVEKSSIVTSQVQGDSRLLRAAAHDLRTDVVKLRKELKMTKSRLNATMEAVRELRRAAAAPAGDAPSARPQRHRHLKMLRLRVAELTKKQEEDEAIQESFQIQLLDALSRIAQCSKLTDANIVSAKVDLLELENRFLKEQIQNLSSQVSDFDKLHVSILELLENVEKIESKVDKTLPEFRMEISKLDLNMAQVNSQMSYTREDQENLRQSVKAIAFSVSNSIDKAVVERQLLRNVNTSVAALEQLSKQHSYRLYDHILKSEANRSEVDSAYDPYAALPELIGEVKDLQPAYAEYEHLVRLLPRDCSDVDGIGTYLIAPTPDAAPVDAWCTGGTTLLQRRFNGSVEFNVKFADYVHPLGRPDSEYWLGLENMHLLTADNCSSMRIDMVDIYGAGWYATYEQFFVGSADGGYKLLVAGFAGNASDAFEYQNRMEFSAIDRDRDISNTHCAGNYEGGWWFSHCQHVNINGKYSLGLTWFDSVKNEWIAVARTEMTMSRRAGCPAGEQRSTTPRPESTVVSPTVVAN